MNFSKINIFDPEFCENRYDAYSKIERTQAICYSENSGCWIIQDFELATAVLSNGDLFSSKPYQQVDSVLLGADNPEHALNRSMIENYYSKHVYWRVPNLQSISEKVSNRLLARLTGRSTFDVIKEFVIPYSVTLGFHLSGLDSIGAKWNVLSCDEEDLGRVIESCSELYFKWELIDPYINDFLKSADAPNFLGVFEDLANDLGHLEQAQWLGFLKTMLIASSETPSSLTGAAFRLLLAEPDVMKSVKNSPSIARQFLYEVLRYNSPAQLTLRMVVEDTVFEGQELSEGDLVAVMIGFVHRDPKRFVDSNKFDLDRPRQPLLSFGKGAHGCIGKHVAMSLAESAVNNVVELLSDKEIAGFKYNTSPQVFAMTSMVVSEKPA